MSLFGQDLSLLKFPDGILVLIRYVHDRTGLQMQNRRGNLAISAHIINILQLRKTSGYSNEWVWVVPYARVLL